MGKVVFNQISKGLNEALAVARGEREPFMLHVPPVLDVKHARAKTGMTQKDFAAAFGFGLDQVKQWEQGRVRPVQSLRAYLMLIDDNPRQVLETLKRVEA